jgi:hypothetical protein
MITFDIYDMLRSYKMTTSDMSLSHVIELTLQDIRQHCVHLHTQIDEYEKSLLRTFYDNDEHKSNEICLSLPSQIDPSLIMNVTNYNNNNNNCKNYTNVEYINNNEISNDYDATLSSENIEANTYSTHNSDFNIITKHEIRDKYLNCIMESDYEEFKNINSDGNSNNDTNNNNTLIVGINSIEKRSVVDELSEESNSSSEVISNVDIISGERSSSSSSSSYVSNTNFDIVSTSSSSCCSSEDSDYSSTS